MVAPRDDNWGIPMGASAMTVDASEVVQRNLFGDYYWTMWCLFNSTIEQCFCSIVQSLNNLKLIRFQISSKHQLKIFPPSNLEVQNTLKFAVLSQTLHCLEDNVWQAGSRNIVFSPEWQWRLKDQTFATFLYILIHLTNVVIWDTKRMWVVCDFVNCLAFHYSAEIFGSNGH